MYKHHSKLKFFSNVYFPSGIDNFELVCLFVKNYKVFAEEQLINLNAKYTVSYQKGVLTIDDEENYVSLFPDWLNLKIICGENGSGKTTILDILDYDLYSAKESFVVLKTPDGFLCNKKNIKIRYKKQPSVILNKEVDHFQPDFLRGRMKEESEYLFPSFLVRSYAENKNIYDTVLETENLFTDFYIFNKIDDRIGYLISRFDYYLKTLSSDFDIDKFRQYYKQKPAFFITAYFINDTLYDAVLKRVLDRSEEYVGVKILTLIRFLLEN